jgi:hypothetical protein
MNRLLRLPELVDIATRPEVIDRMVSEFGPERTREILMVLRAKVEAWATAADEIDLDDSDQRRTD